MNVQVQVELEE